MSQYIITRGGSSDELQHHGVKGQKHGERRYQNPDGSLTAEGREHYGIGDGHRIGQSVKNYAMTAGRKTLSFMDRHKKGLAASAALIAGLGTMGSVYGNAKRMAGGKLWIENFGKIRNTAARSAVAKGIGVAAATGAVTGAGIYVANRVKDWKNKEQNRRN